ncbi:hypothetical protein VNO77_27248 [Canavalia gladiata]|uniref:Uncharacterized protein n=1 Tax=Canavalia gladiata TaxID=3824 RepID=A0AAN9KUC5_CANGL
MHGCSNLAYPRLSCDRNTHSGSAPPKRHAHALSMNEPMCEQKLVPSRGRCIREHTDLFEGTSLNDLVIQGPIHNEVQELFAPLAINVPRVYNIGGRRIAQGSYSSEIIIL